MLIQNIYGHIFFIHFIYLLFVWCASVFICLVVLHFQVWSLKLEQEVEKNKALTEALQTLATEHQELQQSLCKSRRSSTLITLTEDDFYDAVSGQQPLAGHLVFFNVIISLGLYDISTSLLYIVLFIWCRVRR